MPKSRFIFLLIVPAILLANCVNPGTPEPKTLADYRMSTDEPDPPAMTQTVQAEIKGRIPPGDCPVTPAEVSSFEAPEPFSSTPPWPNFFWYGSEHLWTVLPTEGSWSQLPLNPEGYTQKIMWWSNQFVLQNELEPALVVTGERLDAKAPPLKFYGATNAFADDIGEAMLTGVDFPTHGCWKVTGQYKKSELSFVVWIAP